MAGLDVDVQIAAPGVEFADAWRHRRAVEYQGQEFFLLSREDLISSKRAAGRDVDLEDVRLLESAEQQDEEQGR